MILQKIEENKKVQHENFLDYIDCGECYLLTRWINEQQVTVTLNKDTVLEDLCKKHGGDIWYAKFCMKTFRIYKSMSDELLGEDLDKVIDWTKTSNNDRYDYIQLLKALVTGQRQKELIVPYCIVRWAKEGSSRGKDWYRVLKD